MSSDFELEQVEELWRSFLLQQQREDAPTVEEFASAYPELKSKILKLFPMMKQLSDFARDSMGTPAKIGEYEIVRQIGIGGMGIVYEAISFRTGDRVAIKVVEHSLLATEASAQLEKEARLVSGLHHSNIVPVYEIGRHGEKCFYTMKFIDGPNLASVLHQTSGQPANELSSSERRSIEVGDQLADNFELQTRIIRAAASAIGYAHGQGILHRDIKPANLLLDGQLKVWVTDFGLAKLRADDQRATLRSKVLGTPRYVAPEQIRGEADERSDIFGLGLVFYEMSLLKRFGENSRKPIWKGGLRPPSEFNPHVPEQVEQFIMRSVSLDPNDRHQSMDEFLSELDSLNTLRFVGSGGQVGGAGIESRFSQLGAWAALAFGLLLIGGLGFLISRSFGISRPSQTAESVILPESIRPRAKGTGKVGNSSAAKEINGPQIVEGGGGDTSIRSNSVFPGMQPDRVGNHPPFLRETIFQEDGRTIAISLNDVSRPIQLPIHDDSDRLFDGIHVSLTGGDDRELFAVTPSGVLAFAHRVKAERPDDFDRDHRYELTLRVADKTMARLMRVSKSSEDGSLQLEELTLQMGGGILTRVIASNLNWPKTKLIDIATMDGQRVFHWHTDGETVALYASTLPTGKLQRDKIQLTTQLLQRNCGLSPSTAAVATQDGRTFFSVDLQGRLSKCRLLDNGMFDSTVVTRNCGLARNLIQGNSISLGLLDEDRFQLVRSLGNGKNCGQICYSFLRQNRFITMPLSDSSDFSTPTLGLAAWIWGSPNSSSAIRPLTIKVDPASSGIAQGR